MKMSDLAWRFFSGTFLLALFVAVAGFASAQAAPVAPVRSAALHPPAISGPPSSETTPNPTKHPEIYLWPNGAPGSEGKDKDPEMYRLAGSSVEGNDDILIISSVHRPSITVYLPPKQINTGVAFVVAPGGGFSELYITPEGYRVAEWLSQHGIAAFVLKYRLSREAGSSYTMDDSVADIQRAIRTVKARASEWGVDPDRVGVIGFSAGGALAGLAGARFNEPVKHSVDDIDKLSAKPAFEGLIYGTPYLPPIQAQAEVAKDTPPTFLACGADDPVSQNYPDVFKLFRAAGVPTEMHIYAGVSHGFGMQESILLTVASWPDRLREWLMVSGFLSRR